MLYPHKAADVTCSLLLSSRECGDAGGWQWRSVRAQAMPQTRLRDQAWTRICTHHGRELLADTHVLPACVRQSETKGYLPGCERVFKTGPGPGHAPAMARLLG